MRTPFEVRPVDVRRYADGPDALPAGKPRPDHGRTRFTPYTPDEAALVRARELFLMRTQPGLFEPWMAEPIHVARQQVIDTLGDVYDWDCTRCRLAVITPRVTDPCPHCGKR